MIPDLKLFHKMIVTKVACYWKKNRNTDQGSKTENSEINPQIQQVIYDSEVKSTN